MKTLTAVSPFGLSIVLLLAAAQAAAQAPTRSSADPPDGLPVTIARARRYDITSRLNGQTYRLMVATPVGLDAGHSYPVFYVLDGNYYFGAATDAAARQFRNNVVAPAIVVAIGYPTDDPAVWVTRRAFDLTPPSTPRPEDGGKYGGGDTFLRIIEDELKPFVMARYRIDRSKQIIYGQSLGALMALRSLFRNPTAFSTYILSSPSIWWNDREVLTHEEAFAKRMRSSDLRLKVLLTSAGDEQYRGDDPKLLAEARRTRMVDNASELAARLATLDPQKLTVVRTIFDGELHSTVPFASLNRGLRFALPVTEP
jgi:predicted alpha/beta superfamily hydrolase